MEFSLDPGRAAYRIEAYEPNCIKVNGETYAAPIVVLPDHLLTNWEADSVDELEEHHFEVILTFKPKIILLGTGERMQFPRQRLYLYLAREGVGLETMTTAAACRTYAILMAEERNVAAALL